MKILVTGGAGFIGSHLVDSLIGAGHKVCVIDDLSGGYVRNINNKALFFNFDGRDYNKIKTVLDSFNPQVIYHLAANAAENKAQFSPYDVCTRNYDTFLTLTHNMNNLGRFIFVSSIAVYGKAIDHTFNENDDPKPIDLYGVSKLAAENALKILADVHEFDWIIARPHNIYGPRQDMADPYRNVVTVFMNSILNNEPYYIYGDGEQRRCFSYIDGVVEALVNCLNTDSGIYNIGSDKSYSINELSDIVREVTGFTKEPIYLEGRIHEVKIAEADNSKAHKILGYKDSISFEEGIKRTWEYCKSLGYQKPRKTGFEIMSPKIPKNWL